MQEHRELPSYCYNGTLLRILAASRGELESPFSKGRVGSEGTQNIMGALNQSLAKIVVPRLGYTELRVPITGLESTRSQTQIRTHVTAPLEAVFVGYGQDEGQGADGTNPRDRAEYRALGIAFLG